MSTATLKISMDDRQRRTDTAKSVIGTKIFGQAVGWKRRLTATSR